MKTFTLFLSGFFLSAGVFSQAISPADQTIPTVITCTDFHITKPLTELAKEHPFKFKKDKDKEEGDDRSLRPAQTFVYSPADGPQYGEDPSVRQTEMGTRTLANKAPIKNWQGQTSNYRPSDPSGAAGPNHYVQCINSSPVKVFNKSTGANMLTVNLGTLWTPDVANEGDPIVMYDRYADRWFIAQFGSPAKVYIAISTTNDPTGSYYTYTFTSSQFPDYLKFSIWADGYYMTSNQGGRMYCFERDQMLLGNLSSRAVTATFSTGSTSGFYCPLSADADGGLPTVGTPCPFFAYSENAWGGGAIDGVKIWNMAVTWGATPTAVITAQPTIVTSAFDASYNSSWNDVSQQGTTGKLDGIGGVATYRAQYRKWTGYNTVLLNWGVKISSTQRSIRWVELRQTGGTWALYQEGTYTPDIHTRWIGSIAMDDNGSIGMAYNKSSSSMYPSIGYTGRLATDPLGQMTFAETMAITGTGSETSANRYGDYSHLSLDPDGLTFWHTAEYTTTSATTTRVFSFQLATTTNAVVAVASNDADNVICAGQSVTFTATPTNGGTAPTYDWCVNGVSTGVTTVTYTTSTLAAGSVVTCVMTSNLPGVVGSPYTSPAITITYSAAPAISIAAASTTICAGTTGTLTATITSGGTSPTYQWKVNDVNVGTSSPTYASSTFVTGDVVKCVYTSTCGTSSTITSSSVTMTVVALPATPTITNSGTLFTSSSATGNQWYLNGLAIIGATGQTYTATANGNYTVVVSSGACNSATSAISTMTGLGINEVTNIGTHFYIYPNPSNGYFNLVFTSTDLMEYTVRLRNELGQIVFEEKLEKFDGTYTKSFDVTTYGKGQYFLTMTNAKNEKFEKVIVF